MLIKFTYVDAVTGGSMIDAPCANGPILPDVPGIAIDFANESEWPCDAPIFHGHCDAGADPTRPGVIDVLTQDVFNAARAAEMARRDANALAALQAKRASMVVTPWQIRKALNATNLREAVEAGVAAADQATKDAWEFALDFKRTNPLVLALGAVLGKTDEELDALFELALKS